VITAAHAETVYHSTDALGTVPLHYMENA